MWNHQPDFPQNIQKVSAKILKTGDLSCVFHAAIEGQSLSPRRPVDRCDVLRLAAGIVSCEGKEEGRSLHPFCEKNRIIPHRFRRRCRWDFVPNQTFVGMRHSTDVVCFVKRHVPDRILASSTLDGADAEEDPGTVYNVTMHLKQRG
jgi:hypothetical protein